MFFGGMDSLADIQAHRRAAGGLGENHLNRSFPKSALQSTLAPSTSLVGTCYGPGVGPGCGDMAEDNTDKVSALTELGIQVT